MLQRQANGGVPYFKTEQQCDEFADRDDDDDDVGQYLFITGCC
jgi:hypothetical protein